ncbi:carbon-phosphorus lyase complex subunit PhnI [Frankia sp. CNm7]|uniref:Carbon-phosphorus lyase complex subunit PhnI n=1 Tax=Frankia nepalensis TaxID=1836974 RepID=A0A937RK26_9ACTN|nr:carbon-phosphorus lyase complex subunit PhnI [Frankia nepalensis]MBL7497806.1 carbon-phosphorus lyase complex subunit PhnI [Frankia nepalensis]MBL7512664.1 carbon-phosphorus lyase complex subunit PhnI [Frankia nepalensis]MBL7523189.1 carbon-phosphorus lyase complex subunit PhnI [Frankia nepalensis]MBL7631707.1 carbon-phosphorus lyase complex subunit PhnI [Frankia nepalensis]
MYTTVRESQGAIDASARLAREQRERARLAGDGDRAAAVGALVPLLVDQVMAEAGVVEPAVAAKAVEQARGDVSRAVSLLRSWVSCLPREGTATAGWDEIEVERRITPAFSEPAGGQFLGASLDYAPRLLDLGEPARADGPADDQTGSPADGADGPDGEGLGREGLGGMEPGGEESGGGAAAANGDPLALPRATSRLEERDLIAAAEPTEPVDVTRRSSAAGAGRGAFAQFLSRAETGALTALAYTAVREGPKQADPTVVELRAGLLPVTVAHPRTGGPVLVGSVPVTTCELVLYHVQVDSTGEHTDSRFTLGYGATAGRVERRAISAAMLDARVTRAAASEPGTARPPSDDAEWLITALDGQEATGFVEHLKLAHHVSFASDLDRVRAVGAVGTRADGGSDAAGNAPSGPPADPLTDEPADASTDQPTPRGE